ncbi:hypothetical protein J3E69DRAFT_349202, partial [Trichoderma sp. SZMC 28015]
MRNITTSPGRFIPGQVADLASCTGSGVCKGYQHHINTDIALAHWQYFQQTN